jgi:hypothetical protein
MVPQPPPPRSPAPLTVAENGACLLEPYFAVTSEHGFSTFLNALMRYIRFLKTPRVAIEKGTSKNQISCLITITSDLGDSFLPYDLPLAAEVLSLHPEEEVVVWRTVHWKAGMRSLPITFPVKKNSTSSEFRIRVGLEPRAQHDEYIKLSEEGACGVVSVWSQAFSLSATASGAEKLVQRRFKLPSGLILSIYEETGESIARHLWYCYFFSLFFCGR